MNNGKCSICNKEINSEQAPILAMGGFGNPRLLCDDCSVLLETATTAKNVDDIESAMAKISENLTLSATKDPIVLDTVTDIFTEAGARAKKIRDGEYDFSEETSESDSSESEDLPQELLESEEDRLLDEEDAKKMRKFDRIFNWIAIPTFLLAAGFLIGYFIITKL